MDKDVDLSIRLAGLTFKSPIVVASSECAPNLSQVQNLVDKSIGGIVTKTYTSPQAFRIRVRPYPFPLNKFGKAFDQIKEPADLKSGEKYPYTIPSQCPYVPQIDKDSCVLCGECETTCIYNVFKVDQNKKHVTIDEDRCWSCGFCVGICPSQAIILRDRNDKDRVIWNNQGLAMPFRTRIN